MRYPDLKNEKINYTAVAMYSLKRLPRELVEQLKHAGRWEDVVAWAGVAAVEGHKNGWDFKTTYNAAQRAIYHGLKAEGYRKDRGENFQYRVKEVAFAAVQDDEILAQIEIFD